MFNLLLVLLILSIFSYMICFNAISLETGIVSILFLIIIAILINPTKSAGNLISFIALIFILYLLSQLLGIADVRLWSIMSSLLLIFFIIII